MRNKRTPTQSENGKATAIRLLGFAVGTRPSAIAHATERERPARPEVFFQPARLQGGFCVSRETCNLPSLVAAAHAALFCRTGEKSNDSVYAATLPLPPMIRTSPRSPPPRPAPKVERDSRPLLNVRRRLDPAGAGSRPFGRLAIPPRRLPRLHLRGFGRAPAATTAFPCQPEQDYQRAGACARRYGGGPGHS